uniref:Sema5A/B-like TSP-1 type 1 domain-containing protein n=1 Tax=Oncorhynchus tshawytscha TaxID=74940 RepID=A0AAZ3RF80_ONCTS
FPSLLPLPPLLPLSPLSYHLPLCPTTFPHYPWAPWQPCNHDDREGASTSCACRSRSCNSPVPQCGGSNCKGPTIQVANCSRNGGWTPWSTWGQCSTSCGIGYEVRQRSCNNPSPRHGGRVCVGQGRDERLCNEKSPCPLPVFWSSWGSWSQCSAECGGGVHSRVRSCEKGNTCPGCALEYKTCNLEACPEVRRNTPWTPWMPVNVTQDGARQEQRTRYTCRALLPDPHQLQLGKKKVETRVCPNDGTAACETEGKSTIFFLRSWLISFHFPMMSMKGTWSCWASWSHCSATCGGGHYQRTRTCSNPPPANGGDICIGLHTEEALCNTHTCEGMQTEQIHR